jgi:UDP-glucose 4-epimerase
VRRRGLIEAPEVKVLVTGGAGFIGSNLADRLVEEGHHVVVLDDHSSGKRDHVPASANFYRMELDNRWLDRVVEREKPDAVCHLAAQVSVRRSVEDPVFDARVNILGSIGLIEACRAHGVSRFIFASTGGAIYGDVDQVPTPETCPAAPISPYGTSKLCVEHYLHCFREIHDFSSAALRLANVYGPRQDPHGEAGVVAIFSRALLDGGIATINGDGLQTRDYVYVGDIVDAFMRALGSQVQGSFNVGTATETNVNELYELVADAAGSSAAAEHGPARPGEQRRSSVDNAQIRTALGWEPRVQLAEGIGLTVDYFRGQAVAAV